MIRLIQSERDIDRTLLLKSLCGRKMLSYIKAYGLGYDFCRFYEVSGEKGRGFMFFMNSTLIICCDDFLTADEELRLFVQMNLPFRIEGNERILAALSTVEH